MEKQADITDTVLHLLKDAAPNPQRANVCVIMDRDFRVAKAVSGQGYRLVVVGNRFKPLFRFHMQKQPYNPVVAVEAMYRELPLLPDAFDAIVVARPMPKGSDVGRELLRLQRFLKTEGMLMWVHPQYRGMLGRVRRAFSSKWFRMPRHVLCQTAMAHGFSEVGQEVVRGRGISRFVLTRAKVRRII